MVSREDGTGEKFQQARLPGQAHPVCLPFGIG